MCGIHLVRYWLQAPGELQRPSFSAMPVLANPAATAACRRYMDRDLNRTFTLTFLNSMPTPDDPYEVKRARELNQLLGPKGTGQAFDVVLDLHNTTANTGVCLIAAASESSFNLHLCHYLQVVPRGQEGGQGGGRGINVTSVPLGLPPEVLQTKQGKEVGQGG